MKYHLEGRTIELRELNGEARVCFSYGGDTVCFPVECVSKLESLMIHVLMAQAGVEGEAADYLERRGWTR